MNWLDRQRLLELREQSVDAELGEIPLKIWNVARVLPHKHMCGVDVLLALPIACCLSRMHCCLSFLFSLVHCNFWHLP